MAGDPDRANEEAKLGLETSHDTGFTWAVGLAQRALGYIARAGGDISEGQRWLSEALATFEKTESRFDAARTHLALAGLSSEQGDAPSAAAHRDGARQLLTALGLPPEVADRRPASAAGQ
jgi:hypothetical protein